MRIGIIGFGFSGLMVAANLVRAATAQTPLMLYIIDENADGLGVAYSTQNPDHLLNVRANNMSAFADAPDDFVQWLNGADAAAHQAKLGILHSYAPTDFVPRVLYGAYLQSIWRATQEIAAQKNVKIKLVPSRAVAIHAGEAVAVLTQRGDAIAVDNIVLAVGHETKPILPSVKSPHIIQNPWGVTALGGAEHWSSVMLLGAGLTAVDMVVALRRAGCTGEIVAVSRHGLLPQIHAMQAGIFSFTAEEVAAHKQLPQLLRLVRTTIAKQGDWRRVMDALRPHTQMMWQRLTTRDQQRFLTRLLPLWSSHRHRMAPEIAARVAAEMAAGTVRIGASKKLEVTLQENGELAAMIQTKTSTQHLRPSRILNCTGLELNLARSSNSLLTQILADRLVEPHVTGLGVAADHQHRAWGGLYPHLHVIGSLLTGQLLESTAVPELRMQACVIAQNMVHSAVAA
jgi:uncharacterized NAD(P)/FAD-binding protein YdhS